MGMINPLGEAGRWVVLYWRLRGSAGPLHEIAVAVGADAMQNRVGALRAERTFETTDPGIRRLRWQISVATFAIRFQQQHDGPPDVIADHAIGRVHCRANERSDSDTDLKRPIGL
jgi:hypothetical protein